jgi:uncharacterized protein (DUF2141 family)
MIELLAAAEIVLAFEGLKDQGQVLVALYDSEASYKQRNRPLKEAKVPVRAGRAEAAFRDLKPGAYAAMVFHDLNSDGRMNFRLGLPTEPYAVSNNAKGFPIAGWAAARFQAGEGETRHTIRLR